MVCYSWGRRRENRIAVTRHMRTGEYFALIPVRRTVYRVWLESHTEEDAEREAKWLGPTIRATRHEPLAGRRAKHPVQWAVFDYIWEHAAMRPGGVKHMLEALCTPEARLCMTLRWYFKRKRLHSITEADILEYQRSGFDRGKTAITVSHEIQALFRLLRWAKLDRQIGEIRRHLGRDMKICRAEGHWKSEGWVYVRREPPPIPKLIQRRPRKISVPEGAQTTIENAERMER